MKLIDIENINPIRCPQSIEEMRMWLYEMPSVKAIPIEWINQKRFEIGRKICEERCIPYNTTEEEFEFMIYYQIALTKIIEDWRKEHEESN